MKRMLRVCGGSPEFRRPPGATFAWLNTRTMIRSELFHATMSIICHVLINGSKRFTGFSLSAVETSLKSQVWLLTPHLGSATGPTMRSVHSINFDWMLRIGLEKGLEKVRTRSIS
ncbi:hypothetical protein Droror1_Dr00010660 [Drosera rotundifolia]